MFAIYCGLALHHAKLYDKIRRSEQKYSILLHLYQYKIVGLFDLGHWQFYKLS